MPSNGRREERGRAVELSPCWVASWRRWLGRKCSRGQGLWLEGLKDDFVCPRKLGCQGHANSLGHRQMPARSSIAKSIKMVRRGPLTLPEPVRGAAKRGLKRDPGSHNYTPHARVPTGSYSSCPSTVPRGNSVGGPPVGWTGQKIGSMNKRSHRVQHLSNKGDSERCSELRA